LQFLLVLDPLDSLKAYKDTSVAMMRAAQARGHTVWTCEQAALHWKDRAVKTSATRLSLTDNDEDWYRAHETETRELKGFDAVLMRKDPSTSAPPGSSKRPSAKGRRSSILRVRCAITTRNSPSRSSRSSQCPPSSRAGWRTCRDSSTSTRPPC
jgi:hypothetical protein